jgi:HEAT repeat protein
MRHTALLALLVLLFALAAGCGKKAAPPADGGGGGPGVAVQPATPPDPAAARNKQLAYLKSNNQKTRTDAIEELSWLAEEDPAVMPALVEMLRDKGTTGAGRTLANQVNSTREAAALAILKCTNGEKFMKEKGLPVLKEGLSDPSPVIREHTAYTIGQLGAIAKPLAPDVQKLCTDPDENVRGVAFDTLRVTGVADPVALAKLLKDKREDVVRLAAELIPFVTEMPAEAVPPLMDALTGDNSNIHAAAAEGLAAAGPKAAPAAQALADAVKKAYPAEYDPKTARLDGPEASFWKALGRIGEPAVAPTAKLLEHSNMLVRSLAARTLGEIGPAAKGAKDALKKALTDMTVNVAVEAAIALVKLGESPQDALDLMKRAIDAPNEGVAGYAIEAIPRLGDSGKPLVPLAIAKMSDANPNTRAAAIWLVGQLPPAEATKYAAEVGKQATDELAEIRRFAGRILAQIGPAGSPAAEAVGKALAVEKEEDARDQFVEALIAMGPGAKPALPGLLPLVAAKGLPTLLRAKATDAAAIADPASPEVAAALVKAAADDELNVRVAAAEAIGKLNPLPPNALNTLVQLAKSDPKNGPRVAALRAMAQAGPKAKAAAPELDAIANGPQPGLAMWAKVARAAVDGNIASAAPAIRKGLNDRNVQVRAAATEALLLLPSQPDDLPHLLRLLKDVNGPTRASAATGVGRFGAAAKDAVPELRRLLDDREVEVRIAAADALGLIDSAAQPAVRKLKELRFDPQVKFAAQRALDKIGTK